ncbi:hypothetical protein BP5796_08827 [Coleophoma crateriformis]|uniref:ASX DEUBAD domain-containing protein n=1 Tax=Coleophoma crateriformis TaxID=565419 RepID=A0A3D8R8Z1_9HELO|nr:hypothetical protein BP5796_08827 [Coleophoma crateriformis]
MVGRRKKLTGVKRVTTRPTSRAPKRTKLAKILDDPQAALENEDSPIFKDEVNLKAVLSHPKAQEVLRAAGLDCDIYKLPDFATAAARFKEDGSSGRHDPEWQRQALEASERRAAGEFDAYHKERFEQEWLGLDDSEDKLSSVTTKAHDMSNGEARQDVKTSEEQDSSIHEG